MIVLNVVNCVKKQKTLNIFRLSKIRTLSSQRKSWLPERLWRIQKLPAQDQPSSFGKMHFKYVRNLISHSHRSGKPRINNKNKNKSAIIILFSLLLIELYDFFRWPANWSLVLNLGLSKGETCIYFKLWHTVYTWILRLS